MASSPYATGGGGTVLEHVYGAVLLSHLLAGDPVPMLGDGFSPISVRFQAGALSSVDDLLVVGRAPDDGERRLSIGVRRAPSLVAREAASVHLVASYLRVLTDHWREVEEGQWRLGLAVASPNAAVQQVRELCLIARNAPDEAAFRSEVQRPGRASKGVRDRLGRMDSLVAVAATEAAIGSALARPALTWRLLRALQVTELRLEGVDLTDRTVAVGRLRPATRDETPFAADALFSRLVDLVGRYAPSGAEVTQTLLRRDLHGIALARSSSYVRAWRIFDGLAERLHDRTGYRLADPTASLQLDRGETRGALVAEMRATANHPGALIIVGEPYVGKSALTLRAAEQMASAGVVVTALSLHDLPATSLELENQLGGRLADVLAATATGSSGRLLVIDGAESVLQGRGPLLTDIATAGLRTGIGVVAVTRRDGGGAVMEALRKATETVSPTSPPREHEVPELTSTETERLTATFASLAGLAGDSRASLLLSRPGLVDLLLRAGGALDLPAGPLSEADVFAAVWRRLVRNLEVTPLGGPSPEARERALTSLARQRLLPGGPDQPPDATALPSLRSEGLLIPPGPTSAWSSSDQFASDLVQDMSVARLLITEGWGALDQAGSQRWALRGVRLACQAKLADAGDASEDIRTQMQTTFDGLAERHGARWAEMPYEAMLTLGSARDALVRAWPALLDDNRSGLRTLLRLALQRFTEHGFGNPIVLAPLVELAYCGKDDLGQDDRYSRRDAGEQIREVVLAWLRGLVETAGGPLLLRQQVRDRLLATEPKPYDEFAVEALAMLGPDLDERAEGFMRTLADGHGGHLAPAVELIGPVLSMSTHQPGLLIALTEAFYIEKREEDDDGWRGPLEEGIRSHHRTGGFGVPMAAWHYGPFFRLLNTRPVDTIAMINRMLDHAAAIRVRYDGFPDDGFPGAEGNDSASTLPGLDLDLLGVGTRHYVGDGHTWSWYRGSSVGPYPCMSALLAVERFADQLIDTLHVPVAKTIEFLLRDSHNLAMPGLVSGLLVRHFDRAGDLLDRWLVRPELWQLEFSRATAEGILHIQGPDSSDLVGTDRRRYSFRDVAAEMTLKAMAAGDSARLAVLGALADELVRRTREEIADSNVETSEMATVGGWAGLFRPENYEVRPADNDHVVIQYEYPEEVESALAPRVASLSRGNDAIRLQLKYAISEDRITPVETLMEDLALARDLAKHPTDHGALHPADPLAAVASAAIVAHAQGRTVVPDNDLLWAADFLVAAAMRPQVDAMSFESTTYEWAADRSAAVALPALLLPPFERIGFERRKLEDALRLCATSLFDEVRAAFVLGVRPVWASPCDRPPGSGLCRHEVVWMAAQDGLRDSQLGDWDAAGQRRMPEPLDGPYEQTLRKVHTKRLLINRLAHPIVAAAEAARSSSCVSTSATRLLDVLFDAHRRGSAHWAKGGYGSFNERQQARVARVLIETAVAGNSGPLAEYVRLFSSTAPALVELLRDLAVQFTYDESLRHSLPGVWRVVMASALDAVESGADLRSDHNWYDMALAGLLPTPQLEISDRDPDATLNRARESWVSPEEIADLFARWRMIARHEPKAVDALAQLADCASPSWQATTGLVWVESLIDGDYRSVAGRCPSLPDWLGTVRASGQLNAEGTSRWQRIVDGLAIEGDRRAVRLQQIEE